MKKDEEQGSRSARAVLLFIGIVFLCIGIWQTWSTIHLVRTGQHAVGRVFVYRPEPGQTVAGAHPPIEFRTQGGQLVRYRQNGMGERPIGTRFDVLYDPASPAETAVVNKFWQLWSVPMMFLWVGLGFTGLILAGVPAEWRWGRY